MPHTDKADLDVLNASFVNANWTDQVVSTVTSASRPAGTEGQVIYETDTDYLKIFNGSWIDLGAVSQWPAYTPALTQSGAITKTVTYARYNKTGRDVFVVIRLDITSTGAANAPIIVSVPFASSGSGLYGLGSGIVYDASATTQYPCSVVLASSSNFQFVDVTAATAVTIYEGHTGAAFSAAVASGDAITFTAHYESAT